MRATWAIAAVCIASCATTGKHAAGESASGSTGFCMPCTQPCTSPCEPARAAKFDPASGTFSASQSVRLSTPTPGAVIHYTTDGSNPTESSPVYTGAILVEGTTTIKAMAQVPGLPRSDVSSGAYTIARPPEPVARPTEERPPAPVAAPPEELSHVVVFDTGKSTIQPSAAPALDAVADALQEHPEVKRVIVEGHTDAQGGEAVNEQLSQGRAEAVRAYLIDKGVEPDRLDAQGVGSQNPVADNDTPEGREANRRVAFVVPPSSDDAGKTDSRPSQ